MKSNPGGQIARDAVVGRSALITDIWATLTQQSVVITAERRIGKTTVIRKMSEEPAASWTPVFQDLEGCHSANEFAMAVYGEVHRFLGMKNRVTRRAKEFFSAIGGTEIGGVFKLPERASTASWKEVLTRSIEDLTDEKDATGTKLLFFWDEIPFMLANIRDREGEQTAMAVLDLLRSLRQTHGGLRMVITGSVGLHHVITSLRKENYGNSPVNDMVKIDVPPLEETAAVELAVRLIAGESLPCSDPQAAALAIAREADCFPYYIHHIVRALKLRRLEASEKNVAAVVTSQLVDADDPWELLHYRERIPRYYGDDQDAVLLILDELAAGKQVSSINELFAMIKGASTFDGRERLLRLLSLMERDHYLIRNDEGHYRFRFPLIRRWWKINRGL